jgi:class 3 adenylate cyclase
LASEHLERRLTAILAADVAGYSRLTGLDEEGTHLQLREHLSSFVNPKIAEHRGRVVKNTGDGLLAEFGSAVDAVRCAMDVQRGMAKRNAEVPQETRIDFRIGINIGDIILDRGDIFGDGVNVAATETMSRAATARAYIVGSSRRPSGSTDGRSISDRQTSQIYRPERAERLG